MFDPQFILHHVVSAMAFYASTNSGVFPYIALLRLTSEASTPFINIRWLLLAFNMKNSKFYNYNGIMIFIVFGLFRIATIIPLWLIFYNLTNTPQWLTISVFHKILCVSTSLPLDILNLYWYYKIINIVWKFFKNDAKSD